MTERNKIELTFFVKMLALFVWGLISIVTFAGAMNTPETFVKWCAGILLVLNIAVIWRYAKRLIADKMNAIEAIQAKEREEMLNSRK